MTATAEAPTATGRPQRRLRLPRNGARNQRVAGETLPSAVLTRLGHIVLWLLVAGGAGTGSLSLAVHAAASQPPAAVEVPAPTTRVEGFAELYVATYLGHAGAGAEESIAAFYPATVTLSDVTPGAVWVVRTTAAAADQQRRGYWAVTVAADLLTAGEHGWVPAGLRYYTVGVAEVGGTLAATGLPSQVAAPPVAAEAPEPAVAVLGTARDEPAIEAANGFLAAYLAGDGDLDRYTAPKTGLDPVDPAPFAQVEVARVGTEPRPGGGTLLRAEVTATDHTGLVQVLEYSLEVSERDGRFEVAALHPAPPLPEPAGP